MKTTIIRLRRDTSLNYGLVGTHVPASGEVCLVDTVNGLKMKIGDGVTSYNSLNYCDTQLIKGYYNATDAKFYKENSFSNAYDGDINTIYLDLTSNILYFYNGTTYVQNTVAFPNASSSTAGIMKLYTAAGQNTDGTMTQKAITEAIADIQLVVTEDEDDPVLYLKNVLHT